MVNRRDSQTERLASGEAKQLMVVVAAEAHRRLKIASVVNERTMSDIVEEAVLAWLETNA